MRIANGIVFIGIGICLVGAYLYKDKENKWLLFVRQHLYLVALLFVANAMSFALTYTADETEIYVEKGGYGEEQEQIPFVLQKGQDTREITLAVDAQQLTEQQLKKRISEAFLYLEDNMKGQNASLSEVRTSLDYSLDSEYFPFDTEFVSEDYALIDGDGTVQNEKSDLQALGYTEQEIEQGIPVNITAKLWYGDQCFEQIFSVMVFPQKKSALEEEFAKVESILQKKEKDAAHEEGFVVPSIIEGIQVSRSDTGQVTPVQILVAGTILVGLLVLREQENKRKEEMERQNALIRSYPWFINEMTLLLGAGMQVRNIFGTLIRDWEEKEQTGDYRKTLIEELEKTVHAMELGMTEEQAYYQLGRRLKLPCYIKLMTLLEQNVKRGAKGLTMIFEQEELSALEERKNLAKRYGEEAGTKMLGPMILLLLIIMLMIMIPAFWGFM